MNKQSKFLSIVLSIIVVIMAFIFYFTNSLYPYSVIGTSIAAALLFLLTIYDSSPKKWMTLAAACSIVMMFRLLSYFLPTTFIGRDAPAFATESLEIIRTGSISTISLGSYQEIPGALVWNAIITQVIDVPIQTAMVIYPIALSVGLPLGGYLLARYFADERATLVGITAAILLVIEPLTTGLSVRVIPQTFQMITYTLACYALVRWYATRSQRFVILGSLLFLLYMVSYKLPLIMFAGAFIALIIVKIMGFPERRVSHFLDSGRIVSIGAFVIVLTLIQLMILSKVFQMSALDVLYGDGKSETPAIAGGASSTATSAVAGGASSTETIHLIPGIINFIDLWGFRVILLLSGIAWLYLFVRGYKRGDTLLFLFTITSAVLLSFIGYVTNKYPSFPRLANTVMPLCMVILPIALFKWRPNLRRQTLVAVSLMLIPLLTVNPGFVIDDPRTPGFYLTEEETAAKEFGYIHAREHVYADDALIRQVIPSRTQFYSNPAESPRVSSSNDIYQLPRTDSRGLFLLRDVEKYFNRRAFKKLTRLPKPHSAKIYDNGGTKIVSNTGVSQSQTSLGVY